MMFRGQFLHAIDRKGRVSLPARFREALRMEGPPRFILTPAPFEACLHLHPLPAWEELEQRISQLPSLDPNVVRFRRVYVSAAIECELDRARRVLIPPHLREYARLDKEVFFAGMGRSIEVWSKELWDEALSMTDAQEVAFRQAVTEQFRI